MATAPLKSFELKGYQEDFANYIAHLSPESTPFLDMVGKDTSKNYNVQWVYDKNPTTWTVTPTLEGLSYDTAGDDFILPVQGTAKNYAQKFSRKVAVSFSAAELNVYGRTNETKYQLDKAATDLKRQLELVLLSSQVQQEATETLPRKTSGLLDIITKSSPGAANVVFSAGAPTYDDFKSVFKGLHDADSEANVILAHDELIATIAQFQFVDDALPKLQLFKDYKFTDGEDREVTGQVEKLTITDQFGKVWCVCPSRFMEENSVYFIDPKQIEVVYFREPAVIDLDPIGSYSRFLVEAEATVRLRDASKLGAIFPGANPAPPTPTTTKAPKSVK